MTFRSKPNQLDREKTLTIYGRKPVLEALRDSRLNVQRLHLAESNRESAPLRELRTLAEACRADVVYHTRLELSRISRNGKQDQGVALDLECPEFRSLDSFLAERSKQDPFRILALDGITNPQNLGMIIRSACAGRIDGLLLAERGNANLGSLVIKASAGTLFRASIVRAPNIGDALKLLKDEGATICALDGAASTSLFDYEAPSRVVYVLGNETEGISPGVAAQCDEYLVIPMNNGVESLNVAVTAALIAFS
ncbi:MAG: 23S rRNA (guanosine2251-2'-O)-methyltransferase [Halieaceae bacterium]|jgi:23S rRNA (guanosine2251-2'-O)-methyltransferase